MNQRLITDASQLDENQFCVGINRSDPRSFAVKVSAGSSAGTLALKICGCLKLSPHSGFIQFPSGAELTISQQKFKVKKSNENLQST